MPDPQAIVTFTGIAGIESARFLLSRGTRPSSGIITTPLIEQMAPAVGDFVIAYNGTTLTLTDCAVVESFVDTSGGPTLTIRFEDRRWAWNLSEIVGRYNVKEGTDTIKYQKTPQELATLIFEAMGETIYDVTALPNDARPFVDWTNTPCDEALGDLLARLGCDVVPNLSTGGWVVVNVGAGSNLPDLVLYGGEHGNYTVTSPKTPDRLQVVTAPVRYQCLFKLEAVGLETDGTWKAIADLSYEPTTGWPNEDPDIMEGVEDTYVEDGVTLEARDLALATVYRCYRIKEIADADGDAKLNPPGFEDAQAGTPSPPDLEEIDDVLPLLPTLNTTYTTADGTEKGERPKLYGTWGDSGNDEANDENMPPGSKWKYGMSLDCDQGVVRLPFWATYTNPTTGAQEPAKFWLLAVCEANWRGLNKKVYYAEWVNKTGLVGSPVLIKSHLRQDIILKYTAHYDGVDPNDPQLDALDDNLSEVEDEAGYYLDALDDELVDLEGGTASYANLLLIQPDGAIEQVEWVVDGSGITTRASRFTRLAPYLPDYKEMQRQNQAAIDNQAAMTAKFVLIKTGIGVIAVPL